MRIVAAVAVMVVLVGCGSPSRPMPTTLESQSSGAAAAPTTTTSRLPMADVDFSDEADVKFLAALREKGVPIADEDVEIEMNNAGYGVCTMVLNEGETLIDSAAWVMDTYEVPGDQAGTIATTAIDVYCPTARP